MGVKIFEDGPRIYLDMDGVIADFDRAMREYDQPAKVIKLIPGVYQHLKPMPGAIEGVNELINYARGRIFVCTKIPDKAPNAASEKLYWIHAYLPKLMGKVFIVPDKGAVGGKNDVLVDDHPQWANANKFPGKLVKFDTVTDNGYVGPYTEHGTLVVRNWPQLVASLKSLIPGDEELSMMPKQDEEVKHVTVWLNGRSVTIPRLATYEYLVSMAGYDHTRILTVICSAPHTGNSISLSRHKSVLLEEGFVINVADTSNA